MLLYCIKYNTEILHLTCVYYDCGSCLLTRNGKIKFIDMLVSLLHKFALILCNQEADKLKNIKL
jgi:hypothetical protein